MLLEEGLITNTDDPTHKQRTTYSLTEKAIELVPIFAMLGAWGSRHLPVSEELSIRANLLAEGGPAMWAQFMSELRDMHLNGVSGFAGSSVADILQAAYEKVRDRSASSSLPANTASRENKE
jgi:hypothetical protein